MIVIYHNWWLRPQTWWTNHPQAGMVTQSAIWFLQPGYKNVGCGQEGHNKRPPAPATNAIPAHEWPMTKFGKEEANQEQLIFWLQKRMKTLSIFVIMCNLFKIIKRMRLFGWICVINPILVNWLVMLSVS